MARDIRREGGTGLEQGMRPESRGPLSGAGGWLLVVTGAQRKLSYTCHAIPSRATSEPRNAVSIYSREGQFTLSYQTGSSTSRAPCVA